MASGMVLAQQEPTQGMVVEKLDAHIPGAIEPGPEFSLLAGEAYGSQHWLLGQVFTAQNTGEVTRANMLINYGTYPPYDLLMKIQTLRQEGTRNVPGDVLATSVISASTLSQESGAKMVTGNFDSNPARVVAGEKYYLTLESHPSTVWSDRMFVEAYGPWGDHYADGYEYFHWIVGQWFGFGGGTDPGHDFWFEIYVSGLDDQAPTVEISNIARAGDDNDYTATFSSPDEYVDFFEIKLDEGEWVRATSPLALNDLSYGNHTLYVRATDTANNTSEPVSRVFTVEHPDTEAPLTTAIASTADGPYEQPGAWTNKDVKVEFSAADAGSGVKEIIYVLNGGTPIHVAGASAEVTVSQEGVNEIAYYAEDQAGRVEATKVLTVKLDKTAPVIERGTVPEGWSTTDISVPFTASDKAPAGVAEVSGLADPADADFTLSTSVQQETETADAQTGTRQVADNAGNVAIAGPVGGLKVDKKAPDIVIATPPEGATYLLNQEHPVIADYSATDGGSGLAEGSPAGPVSSGAAIDTATVGDNTFTVTATDNVGNQATLTRNYRVIFDFGGDGTAEAGGGFLAPVDDFPTLNEVKAGAMVPVKFSLGGNYGEEIFYVAPDPLPPDYDPNVYPLSREIAPKPGTPIDPLPVPTETNAAGLRYDETTGKYVYNWKTDSDWSGQTRQLVFKFKDGSEHLVNFKFK